MATLAQGVHKMREIKGLYIAIWVAQICLIGVFGMTGYAKTFQPVSELSQSIAWVADVPEGLVRFIGICELAGALGLVLPSIIRFLPGYLTPLASMGLMTIMVLAMGFHTMRGEISTLPINIVLGGAALFVAWGRYRKYPIHPSGK
jgi:uncharacterized membrane protein YphA (DoxX/SURF4 family)